MLTAQEIANYLVKNLDAIAATRPKAYEFSILGEIAEGYDGKKINGMVRTVSAELSPLPAETVEAKYVFAVEMFVEGTANRRYLNISSIINEFIKANQSTTVAFENGKGVVTFTMGVPKSYKAAYELGSGVPLTFTVNVTYTENAVSSGDKHWLLDGVEIPFLSESVTVEREGIPRKIYTEVYSKILLTGQTKFYTFRIPYESATFKALQAEILQAPAVNAVEHTLTYYDGAAFTEDKPYTSKVTIFKSASSSSARPNGSAYEVTFTDVYNSENQPLKYELALIDFPFDQNGDDTRYFNSVPEQTEWFEARAAASSAPFITIQAPNLEGVVITKQVYRLPAPSAISQFDLAAKNYAIIKVTSAADGSVLYFYYFIENSVIGADGCVMLDLKMDTVQTYFFKPEITFSDCLIERAHLNRFAPVEGDSESVKFVTDPASKIYNSEQGLNFPKRLVDRQKLKLRYTGNDEVDEWLNENVAYWVYVFIDPSHDYSVEKVDYSTIKEPKVNGSLGKTAYPIGMNGVASCYCYPIYKNASGNTVESTKGSIIVNVPSGSDTIKDFKIVIGEKGREFFELLNNETSYYYSIKLSIVPPFSDIATYYTENNNLIITANNKTKDESATQLAYAEFEGNNVICTQNSTLHDTTTGKIFELHNGVFFGSKQKNTSLETYVANLNANRVYGYPLKENEAIRISNIVGRRGHNLELNPKLNGQSFKELIVTASSGDTFAYDIQKLNDSRIMLLYSEPIQPEITKYYLRVKGGTGLYEDGTGENYTGLVGSTDNSIAYTNDQYANFIANNKNFYLQSNMKIGANALQSGMNIATQAANGNILGAAVSGVSSLINMATSAIDRDMTIDNMKNAPDQLKNANGNPIFNLFAMDLGLYIERYEALEGDLQTANDFMDQFGYAFNTIAQVKNYVNMRRYHNYVKAQLESIKGNLSNSARLDLKQRFSNGIRFWEQDYVSYDFENYEFWLEFYK